MTELNYREAYLKLFNHISDIVVTLEDALQEAEETATGETSATQESSSSN